MAQAEGVGLLVTTSLASLTGIPALARADGTPIYIERVRAGQEAHIAVCRTCGYIMGEGQFWGLREAAWLHTNGASKCQSSKVTYWRYL